MPRRIDRDNNDCKRVVVEFLQPNVESKSPAQPSFYAILCINLSLNQLGGELVAAAATSVIVIVAGASTTAAWPLHGTQLSVAAIKAEAQAAVPQAAQAQALFKKAAKYMLEINRSAAGSCKDV